MSKTMLDLMPKEVAEKAVERAKRRLEKQKSRSGLDVSPEVFLVAKAGMYWGWDAVMAIRRGFTVDPELDSDGSLIRDDNGEIVYKANTLTLDEVSILLEGADKVRYSQLIEQTHSGVISNTYKLDNKKTLEGALQPFAERAEVKE